MHTHTFCFHLFIVNSSFSFILPISSFMLFTCCFSIWPACLMASAVIFLVNNLWNVFSIPDFVCPQTRRRSNNCHTLSGIFVCFFFNQHENKNSLLLFVDWGNIWEMLMMRQVTHMCLVFLILPLKCAGTAVTISIVVILAWRRTTTHTGVRKELRWFDWYLETCISSFQWKLECDGDKRERLSYRNRCDAFCYCHSHLDHCCQAGCYQIWITTGNSYK